MKIKLIWKVKEKLNKKYIECKSRTILNVEIKLSSKYSQKWKNNSISKETSKATESKISTWPSVPSAVMRWAVQYLQYEAHGTVEHGGIWRQFQNKQLQKRATKGKRSGYEFAEVINEIIVLRMSSEVTGSGNKRTLGSDLGNLSLSNSTRNHWQRNSLWHSSWRTWAVL